MRTLRILSIGLVIGIVGSANSQMFFNGNFEAGNMSAWTVGATPNGLTGSQSVGLYDIDGPGTRPTNFAAQFEVGQITFNSGVPAGMQLTQSLSLTAGYQYYFDFDWSVHNAGTLGNTEGGIFSLIVNGTSISSQAAGSIGAGVKAYGHVTGIFTPTSSGAYTIGGRIERPFTLPGSLLQYVDNFAVTAIVPEPTSLAVLALGGAFLSRRRRKV